MRTQARATTPWAYTRRGEANTPLSAVFRRARERFRSMCGTGAALCTTVASGYGDMARSLTPIALRTRNVLDCVIPAAPSTRTPRLTRATALLNPPYDFEISKGRSRRNQNCSWNLSDAGFDQAACSSWWFPMTAFTNAEPF